MSELFGERTHVVSPTGLVERDQFYRTLVGLQEGGKKKEEEIVTFAEKMERINKEKSKQDEFFEPVRQYVGESEISGLGFDARKDKSCSSFLKNGFVLLQRSQISSVLILNDIKIILTFQLNQGSYANL